MADSRSVQLIAFAWSHFFSLVCRRAFASFAFNLAIAAIILAGTGLDRGNRIVPLSLTS
jgi:hypothetical protein